MAERPEDRRIQEALELLNDAAKDRRAELMGMISDRYGSLRSALVGIRGSPPHRVRLSSWQCAADDVASSVDDCVRRNPWPYLVGSGLGFLVLGLLLGRPRR